MFVRMHDSALALFLGTLMSPLTVMLLKDE